MSARGRWAALACALSLGMATVAIAGCAGSPRAGASAGETLPTPYTADEIRVASPAGRRIELRVDAPGRPVTVRVLWFLSVDAAGADVESSTLDETGHEVGKREKTRSTWEELRQHAAFPRATTTVSEATVTVGAGTFDCRVYAVSSGGRVTTFWFARSLPGPPVKMTVEVDGAIVETRTLVRHLSR